MNTIAIIEDNSLDFKSISKIFDDTSKGIWPNYDEFWQTVYPKDIDYQSIEFDDTLILNICKQIEDNIDTISAIIMDISLKKTGTDDLGLKIIEQIRKKDEFKYRFIPIFCYSQLGDSKKIRKQAFAVGATNVFSKESVDVQSPDAEKDMAELKITLDYHMLAYQLSKYAIPSFERMEDSLIEEAKKINILVEMVTSLIKLDKLNEISEDVDKEEMIKSIFGGDEKLEEVKKRMISLENLNDQEKILDAFSDLMTSIPVLNVFSKVFKGFSLLLKFHK